MANESRAPFVRRAAVAGRFYPGDPAALRSEIAQYLARVPASDAPPPKAVIVPHAGYVYSGPVAASAYRRVAAAHGVVSRVVLIGPAHRVRFRGLATSAADAFATPLGEVPLDRAAIQQALMVPQVQILDEAHEREHSLEVQLPFLQVTLGDFQLVPFAVGQAHGTEVAEVLRLLWGGPETLIVISSDLSHYHDYDTARRLDAETAAAIAAGQPERLAGERACGYLGIRGLLEVAGERQLRLQTLDCRNSGDTAGPRDQVVGYGAWETVASGG